MAQRVHVVVVCDLHGDDTPGTETVPFALDDAAYEIDLCERHAAQLREAFAGYVGAARRAGTARTGSADGQRRRGRRSRGRGQGQDSAAIREWARSQGVSVNERGRIPASVVQRYEAAHA